MINRMGPTFVRECLAKSNATHDDIAKAYIIVRESFGLRDLWREIEGLDNKVPALVQLRAFREIAHMTERTVMWLLTRTGHTLDINKDIASLEKGIESLRKNFDSVVTPGLLWTIQQITKANIDNGLPERLSHDIALMPLLGSACDIIRTAAAQKTELALTAKIYFELGEHFHLDWMRTQASYLVANDRWSIEALDGVVSGLYSAQAGLTVQILNDMNGELGGKKKTAKPSNDNIVTRWIETHGASATAVEPIFADMRKATNVDLPMLIIAEQKLRGLYGG